MTKGAMAALSAGVAVFGFDPEPGTPASRALHVLTLKRTLPTGDLGPKERFPEAALRAATEAGIDLGGRRGTRGWPAPPPGRCRRRSGAGPERHRLVLRGRPVWSGPRPGRLVGDRPGLHLDAPGAAALRAALDRLRADTRQLAGAAALVGRRVHRVTTCSACTWRSTVAPRAASGPSGAGSRSCAIPACSGPSGTPRWPRCASGFPDSGRRRAPAAGRPSCSAIPVPAARTSSWQRSGHAARADPSATRRRRASQARRWSATRVTGPSLTRSTAMWAPKRPVSTWCPRSRSAATKAS